MTHPSIVSQGLPSGMEILKYFQPWHPAGLPMTEISVLTVERGPETQAHKNSKGTQADRVSGASYCCLVLRLK